VAILLGGIHLAAVEGLAVQLRQCLPLTGDTRPEEFLLSICSEGRCAMALSHGVWGGLWAEFQVSSQRSLLPSCDTEQGAALLPARVPCTVTDRGMTAAVSPRVQLNTG